MVTSGAAASGATTAVILVAYNSGDTLLTCLDALLGPQRREHPPVYVSIIDNASAPNDRALRTAKDRYPEITALPLRRNIGFGRAVNLAVSRLPAQISTIITLNPDTLPPAHLSEMLTETLAVNPELGGVGATLTFQRAPRIIASAGVDVHRNGVAIDRYVGQHVDLQAVALQAVAGISGGAAAWRRAAFEAAGGFADPFFMYLEDVDLSLRLRLAGWELAVCADLLVPHAYSASAGEGSPFKRRFLSRNRLWTIARTWPTDLLHRDRVSMLAFDALVVAHATATGDRATLRGRAEGVARLPWRLEERNGIHATSVIDSEAFDRWVQPALSPRTMLRLRRLTRDLALGVDQPAV